MVELARHLRHLESLTFEWVTVEPFALMAYVAAEASSRMARALAEGGAAGHEQGSRRVRVEIMDVNDQDGQWSRVRGTVQALGLDWLDLIVHM